MWWGVWGGVIIGVILVQKNIAPKCVCVWEGGEYLVASKTSTRSEHHPVANLPPHLLVLLFPFVPFVCFCDVHLWCDVDDGLGWGVECFDLSSESFFVNDETVVGHVREAEGLGFAYIVQMQADLCD